MGRGIYTGWIDRMGGEIEVWKVLFVLQKKILRHFFGRAGEIAG